MYAKGDTVTVKITDMGKDGEGIGKIDTFPFFIKDAVIGDVVNARVMKRKKNYAYAKLISVEESSPFRVRERCPVAKSCGGCQIQGLAYDKQLEFKESTVKGNLIRIGGFDKEYIESVFEPIIGMEDPWRYRNKAIYPVARDKSSRLVAGFYARHTHSVVECADCLIGAEENAEVVRRTLTWMEERDIPAYDEATGEGLVRNIFIRKGFGTGELGVCIIANGSTLPYEDELVSSLREIPKVTSICLNINRGRDNAVMGGRLRALYGREYIEDELMGLRFRISPLSFYQVNPVQTKKLYETVLEFAALKGTETVWDICCGIGTISLVVAKRLSECEKGGGRVFGLEIVPRAVENARENAALNGLDNVEFVSAAAEEYLPGYVERRGFSGVKRDGDLGDARGGSDRVDVVIVDPPRKGLDIRTVNAILSASPDRIVYVSCDSATLARDLKLFNEGGYTPTRIRPTDMFGHSCHCETVCILSKLSSAKEHIEVTVNMDELDLTSAEAKATYKEIQEWVQEHYGMHVTNLNIAQVKQKHGIIERENYNKPKSPDSKQPGCPEEKVKAIEDAMRHFQMI